MAGTIEFIQGAIKHGKADWAQKFPAIEDIMVVHNTALEQLCPMYMKQYLDKDKTAFYLLARCNPLKGDCSRQMACAWLEDLFYDKCGCPSSYDIEAGGTMSRKVAISKELLPADNDAEYMDYYQEQMAKMKEMFSAEQKAAKKEEFIAKNGFDPDDPDIIDIEVDGEPVAQVSKAPGTTSVEQSAGTAVGMPKPIWYGAVFHANGFGMKLGYNKKVWTLSQGATTIDKLGFNPAGPQLTEKEEDEMVGEALNGGASVPQLFDDLLAAVGKGTPIWNDLMDVKDKYDLNTVTVGLEEEDEADECEKCGDDSCKDGEKCGLKEDAQNAWKQKMVLKDADGNVLDSYEWECSGDEQANSDGVIEAISKFDAANPEAGFVDANDEIFDALVIDQAPWTDGTFTIELDPAGLLESKNPYDETDEETVSEIKEILDEEDRGMEDELDEYAKIEDDVEEDDEEELSESVIRHATMLAREIR